MRLTRTSARLHPSACNDTEMSASVVHRNWISVHAAFIQPAPWTTSWRIRCSQGLRRNLKHLPVSGTMPGMTCWRFARKALQTRWASWLSFFCNCTSSKVVWKSPWGQSVFLVVCFLSRLKKTLGIFWGIVTFYMDMLVCHLKMRSAHVSSLGCITAISWILQGLYWNGFLREQPIQIMDWLRQHERRNFTGGSPGGRSKCHFSSKGCCRDSDSLPLKVLRSGRMGKLYGCPVHKMCSSWST